MMNQPSAHVSGTWSGRWSHDDLAAMRFRDPFGVFVSPKEGAAGANAILQGDADRVYVIIPGGDSFDLEIRRARVYGEQQRCRQERQLPPEGCVKRKPSPHCAGTAGGSELG